jgi:hypothetical protein
VIRIDYQRVRAATGRDLGLQPAAIGVVNEDASCIEARDENPPFELEVALRRFSDDRRAET